MISAGIKINYGKIESRMGEPMARFVQKTVSFVDGEIRRISRINVSTQDFWCPSKAKGKNRREKHTELRLAVKKSGLKHLFDPWRVAYFKNKDVTGIFTSDNFLAVIDNPDYRMNRVGSGGIVVNGTNEQLSKRFDRKAARLVRKTPPEMTFYLSTRKAKGQPSRPMIEISDDGKPCFTVIDYSGGPFEGKWIEMLKGLCKVSWYKLKQICNENMF